jgi:lysine decarboxylase
MRDLEGHTSAVMVLPYPPGVPLIMPGEKITKESRAVLDYLIMLEEIGSEVPGFGTDIHGVEEDEDGELIIKVLD